MAGFTTYLRELDKNSTTLTKQELMAAIGMSGKQNFKAVYDLRWHTLTVQIYVPL